MMSGHRELLRRLAIADDDALRRVVGGTASEPELLDEVTVSVVRLAGLIAVGGGGPSYQSAVDHCRAAGVEDGAIVEVVAAIAPIIGEAQAQAGASRLAAALAVTPKVGDT